MIEFAPDSSVWMASHRKAEMISPAAADGKVRRQEFREELVGRGLERPSGRQLSGVHPVILQQGQPAEREEQDHQEVGGDVDVIAPPGGPGERASKKYRWSTTWSEPCVQIVQKKLLKHRRQERHADRSGPSCRAAAAGGGCRSSGRSGSSRRDWSPSRR